MKRIFLIFNPAARGEKATRMRDTLYLHAASQRNVILAPTTTPGEAQSLAAQAVSEGYDLIAAAGGDGTINEVINGIGTSGVPLALLPMGTINVFARELGVPLQFDHALALLETGKPRAIDLACAESGGAPRYFAQLAGVGVDAASIHTTSWDLKKQIGPLSYVWAGLKALMQRHPNVEVRRSEHADSGPSSAEALGRLGRTNGIPSGPLVLIGNGRFYGGEFVVFPQAQLEDGLLDVCIFERADYLSVVRYIQGVMRGVHVGFPDVSYFQTSEFACRAAERVPFELDGELAGETPVRFFVKPRALRVMVPP